MPKRWTTILTCVVIVAIPAVARPWATGRSEVRLPRAAAQPTGDRGHWKLAFDDEFNGTSLNRSKWLAATWGHNDPANVTESGGDLILTFSSAGHAAEITSAQSQGAGPDGYAVPVGGFVEARIEFPGSGASIDDWPTFWTSDVTTWPASGEHDIAEGLGDLTTNYHSPSGTQNFGTAPGTWSGSFHTYGMYRGATYATIYWDGRPVKTYATNDDGKSEPILLSQGGPGQGRVVYGAGSRLKVDYVRAWTH